MRNVVTLGIAGFVTAVAGYFAYAVFVASLAAVLGPLAMLAFYLASFYSEGAVPALGYVASSSVLFVLLLAAMFPSTVKRPAPRS